MTQLLRGPLDGLVVAPPDPPSATLLEVAVHCPCGKVLCFTSAVYRYNRDRTVAEYVETKVRA